MEKGYTAVYLSPYYLRGITLLAIVLMEKMMGRSKNSVNPLPAL